MRHLMICVSGFSGTGKDEFAGRLVREHGAVQTGLADPAKRHMADVYGFTEHQLFGPSSARNAGDLRLPKSSVAEYGLRPSKASSESPPEGLKGDLIPGTAYWEYEGRGSNRELDLPYVPLRLGNARTFVPEGHPFFWLSPREALQRYCELMNQLYLDTWIRKGIEVHRKLSEIYQQDGDEAFFRYSYSRMQGLVMNDLDDGTNWCPYDGTFISCFADFRHRHEVRLAHLSESESLIPVLVRVRRPSVPNPPFNHRSETEQATIPDEAFDFVVDNDGDLEDLYAKADAVIRTVEDPDWSHTRIVRSVMES